jgi:hypothetical protein
MENIEEIIARGRKDIHERCKKNALHIASHPVLIEQISNSVNKSQNLVGFCLLKLPLTEVKNDFEWNLICMYLKEELSSKGVGFERTGGRDIEIILSWSFDFHLIN